MNLYTKHGPIVKSLTPSYYNFEDYFLGFIQGISTTTTANGLPKSPAAADYVANACEAKATEVNVIGNEVDTIRNGAWSKRLSQWMWHTEWNQSI